MANSACRERERNDFAQAWLASLAAPAPTLLLASARSMSPALDASDAPPRTRIRIRTASIDDDMSTARSHGHDAAACIAVHAGPVFWQGEHGALHRAHLRRDVEPSATPTGTESGWRYAGPRNVNDWYQKLTSDPAFMAKMKTRYTELRQGLLSQPSLDQRMDTLKAPLTQAVVRDFAKWSVSAVIKSAYGFSFTTGNPRHRSIRGPTAAAAPLGADLTGGFRPATEPPAVFEAQERDGAVRRNWRDRAATDAFAFGPLRSVDIFSHRTISPQRSRISAGDQWSPLFGATPSVMPILKAESWLPCT